MHERWPELDYVADRPVGKALHAYLQLIGKLPTRGLAWANHGWHTALRVVPRGFRTQPVPLSRGEGELLLDCLDGCIRLETSPGMQRAVDLRGRCVADVHTDLAALLDEAGCPIEVSGAPNEVDPAVPFVDTPARTPLGRRHRAPHPRRLCRRQPRVRDVPYRLRRQIESCPSVLGQFRSGGDAIFGPRGAAASRRHSQFA